MADNADKTSSVANEKSNIEQVSSEGAKLSSVDLANYYEDNAGSKSCSNRSLQEDESDFVSTLGLVVDPE